ncbi:hypothetical protein ScPMuIL_007396 [Solemya velum]
MAHQHQRPNMNTVGTVLVAVLAISTLVFADENGQNGVTTAGSMPFSGSNGPVRLPNNFGSVRNFASANPAGFVGDINVVSEGTPVSVVSSGVGVGAPSGFWGSDSFDVSNDGNGAGFDADLSIGIGSETIEADGFGSVGGIGFSGGFSGPIATEMTGTHGDGFIDSSGFGDGGMVTVSGPAHVGGSSLSFGSPVRMVGPGFQHFGFGSGVGSVDAFTRQFGNLAGLWNSNAWSFGLGGGNGLSAGVGFSAPRRIFASRNQMPIRPVPIGPLPGGSRFGSTGMRVTGSFGRQKFGSRGVPGTTVINDADTAVVNTRTRGNAEINDADHVVVNAGMSGNVRISDADTAIVHGGGRGRTVISDADTAIVNTGRRGPIRPRNFVRPAPRVQVRAMRRPMRTGFQFRAPARPIFPARLPIARPIMPIRPMPRFTYRNSFGLGSFSRMGGLRSNLGRYNVLRRIASTPIGPTFMSTGIVPGNAGYSTYYTNKYTPSFSVMRPQYFSPSMGGYGGGGGGYSGYGMKRPFGRGSY